MCARAYTAFYECVPLCTCVHVRVRLCMNVYVCFTSVCVRLVHVCTHADVCARAGMGPYACIHLVHACVCMLTCVHVIVRVCMSCSRVCTCADVCARVCMGPHACVRLFYECVCLRTCVHVRRRVRMSMYVIGVRMWFC